MVLKLQDGVEMQFKTLCASLVDYNLVTKKKNSARVG